MGAITLVSGLWLLLTPIPREASTSDGSPSGIGRTLALLSDKTILLLFFGIFYCSGHGQPRVA